ncbi:MAG: hypothetical protein ACKO5K_16075 [Armatimonadota bacterium]
MARALDPERRLRVADAIARIGAVPGYASVARDLGALLDAGRIRHDPDLEDRAVVEWTGMVVLGEEPFQGASVGLEETLVHEHHHRKRQANLMKSASFWTGVVTKTPVMARYERPAYRAALDYLAAVGVARPDDRIDAEREAEAVRRTWEIVYRLPL